MRQVIENTRPSDVAFGGSQWESEDGPARSVTVSETCNLAETGKAVDLSQLGTPCTNPDMRSICLSASAPTWAQIEDCRRLEGFIRDRLWFTVREIRRIPLVEDYSHIYRRNTEGWRHMQRKASAEAWLRSLGYDDVEFESPAVYGDADVRSRKAGLTVECGQCIPWRLFTVIECFGDPVMVLPYGDNKEWETGYLFIPQAHAHLQLRFTGVLKCTA